MLLLTLTRNLSFSFSLSPHALFLRQSPGPTHTEVHSAPLCLNLPIWLYETWMSSGLTAFSMWFSLWRSFNWWLQTIPVTHNYRYVRTLVGPLVPVFCCTVSFLFSCQCGLLEFFFFLQCSFDWTIVSLIVSPYTAFLMCTLRCYIICSDLFYGAESPAKAFCHSPVPYHTVLRLHDGPLLPLPVQTSELSGPRQAGLGGVFSQR